MGNENEIRNNEYLLNLNMDNASVEERINWLYQIIDNELQKPEDEIDVGLIAECSDYLNELIPKNERYSEEELEIKLAALKAEVEAERAERAAETATRGKIKNSKRVAIKIYAIIAAVLVTMFLTLSIAASVNGYSNGWEFLTANISEFFGLLKGEKTESDGITLIKNSKATTYKSIGELVEKEKFDILYPTILPDEIKIIKIQHHDEGDGKFTLSFVCTSDSLSIFASNYYEILFEEWKNPTIITLNNIEFYFIDDNGIYLAAGQYNGYEYSITYNDYEKLIIILENLKGN